MEAWVEVLSTVGFPIFVAIIMIDLNKKSADRYGDLYLQLIKTIDSNTRIIDELVKEMREIRKID